MIGQTCFTLRAEFFCQHGFKKHVRSPSACVLSMLAVIINKLTKRNVKTMRKENSASWVDLFYRLAPFLTPQNTLKYIRYWFWRFWSTFQFTVETCLFFAEINYGKNYQLWKNIPDYRPSASNKRQLNQTGVAVLYVAYYTIPVVNKPPRYL